MSRRGTPVWVGGIVGFGATFAAGWPLLLGGMTDGQEAAALALITGLVVVLSGAGSVGWSLANEVLVAHPAFETHPDGFTVSWVRPADWLARVWSTVVGASAGWVVPGGMLMVIGAEAFGFASWALMMSACAGGLLSLFFRRALNHRVELRGRVLTLDRKRVVLTDVAHQVEIVEVWTGLRLSVRSEPKPLSLVGDPVTVRRIASRLERLEPATGSLEDVPEELRELQHPE